MRKIFFLFTLLMMTLSATVFAAESDDQPTADEPYIYTSKDFKFSITCPIKPLAVVQNPWQEPEKRGEMLVFANEGFDVQYAYIIQVNAFDDKEVPDFNKGSIAAIGDYITNFKKNSGFADAKLIDITKKNKGIQAVTADKIEMLDDKGKVEGELVADRQYIYTFFRTPEGRCISIQLVCANLEDKRLVDTYRFGIASFIDNSKDGGKKAKKLQEKREKEKLKKEQKNKK